MARQEFNGKSPPGLHDTIPSGKDTSKTVRPPDLSREQGKDSCPVMLLRTCSKIQNKASSKKNQPNHDMMHGNIKPAMQTLTHTTYTQLLPRRGTSTMTVISYKTHLMKNISKLSPLLGRPDTIPSGKDTGIPVWYSDRCRGVSTVCNIRQTRNCKCRL